MNTNSFLEEISTYSIYDLKLIFETQKDLYSAEEMELIQNRIQELEEKQSQAQKEFIEKNLPKEILCPKCDGANPFENDTCCFCGYKLDKRKYYSIEFYQNDDSGEIVAQEEENSSSYTFQFVISLLIPLVGFILGSILLGKDDEYKKSKGKTCIILGIVSTVICAILNSIAIFDLLFN